MSNNSGNQGRGTTAFSKALSTISNTVQKWVGAFGQKGLADKKEVAAIKQKMAEQINNIINEKLDKASKPLNQSRIQRPSEPPPPPPIATNASQQGTETSVPNGSEPVKPDVSISDIKMTPDELTKAWAAIALANASFEKQYRQQK